MTGDRLIRAGLVVSLTVVTAVAVVISYGHLWGLAKDNGEKGAAAAVLPITVDGLILATSLVIVNAARNRSRPPVLAWVMLLAGIGATLAGNVAHGIEHGWSGSLVAGWPAVVAAGMFHLAIGEIKRGREPETSDNVTSFPELEPDWWSDDRPVGMELWEDLATAPPAPAEPVATGTALDRWFDGTEPGDQPVTSKLEFRGEATDPEVEAVVATARERFADDLAAGRVPSIRSIRKQIKVGYPRAVQVHAALSGT